MGCVGSCACQCEVGPPRPQPIQNAAPVVVSSVDAGPAPCSADSTDIQEDGKVPTLKTDADGKVPTLKTDADVWTDLLERCFVGFAHLAHMPRDLVRIIAVYAAAVLCWGPTKGPDIGRNL